MGEYKPTLDRSVLQRLAGAVRALRETDNKAVPIRQILELAGTVPLHAEITIDFKAAESLGQPLIVLRYGFPPQPAGCLSTLSKREWQIAALVAGGLSNKQIAHRLFITLATVKDHVHRILGKTGLPNRAAIAAAYLGHRGP